MRICHTQYFLRALDIVKGKSRVKPTTEGDIFQENTVYNEANPMTFIVAYTYVLTLSFLSYRLQIFFAYSFNITY